MGRGRPLERRGLALEPRYAPAAARAFVFAEHPAAPREVLRVLSGSHAYGLEHAGSDLDVRGVYMLPTEALLGLDAPGSERAPRTLRLMDEHDDVLYYELGHLCALALEANPAALEVLYTPAEQVLRTTVLGEDLRALRSAFLSRRAARTYPGYARELAAKVRLTGPRALDYDRRAALHSVRVCHLAIALLRTGELDLRVPPRLADELHALRRGERAYGAVRARIDHLLGELDETARTSMVLPPDPDRAAVEAFLRRARTDLLLEPAA